MKGDVVSRLNVEMGIMTPFDTKGLWSLIWISDRNANKGAAIIHTDAGSKISDILRDVHKEAKQYPHPMLLVLQLLVNYHDMTAEILNEVLKDLDDVNEEIKWQLGSTRNNENKANGCNFANMSQRLHDARIKVVQLTRRNGFEVLVSKGLQHLPERIDNQAAVLYSLIAQHDARLQYQLATETFVDSKAMKTLAIITIVFLPGTSVATLFATNMIEFESGQEGWIYVVVVIPTTRRHHALFRILVSEHRGDDSAIPVPDIFIFAPGMPVVVNQSTHQGLKLVSGASYTALDIILDKAYVPSLRSSQKRFHIHLPQKVRNTLFPYNPQKRKLTTGKNAKDIRHVHIRFPKVLENGDGLFISDQSAQILDKVQSACTGLTKVTFGPVCAFDGRVSPYLESPEKTSNLFRLVNKRLQPFLSPWSITIVILASNAYRHISDELKNRYAWNVIEEEDWSQFVSGILAGIGAGNRPRLRNTDDGEMDGGSSGSSHDTKVDVEDDSSSNTTVNTGSTGDGLHIDGSDEGFDETENPELYAYYQLGRLP
ncbi:hypothetical protein TCE0_011r00612 [Talaromyces pinophilus]|uniref:Uncharacterized protein n=1 Tax=Talaromyces pinophilus TaxID=128442 RepID=A0A0B8N0I8_TALPI|nr:hypothetical protein TCE0_011r00612 [Talaromyces pinophilus]